MARFLTLTTGCQLVQMRGQMEANADHMPTRCQRMVHVQGGVAGLAMKHLQPRLRADVVIQFARKHCLIQVLPGSFFYG